MLFRASLTLGAAALAAASSFKWLPLGDSITWGCGNGFLPHAPDNGCEEDAASYRIPTAQALEQANISITTVGTRTAGPASSPASWRAHVRAARRGAARRGAARRGACARRASDPPPSPRARRRATPAGASTS